jgi:hypothetical protein
MHRRHESSIRNVVERKTGIRRAAAAEVASLDEVVSAPRPTSPRLRHVPEERSDGGPARSAEWMPVRSAAARSAACGSV